MAAMRGPDRPMSRRPRPSRGRPGGSRCRWSCASPRPAAPGPIRRWPRRRLAGPPRRRYRGRIVIGGGECREDRSVGPARAGAGGERGPRGRHRAGPRGGRGPGRRVRAARSKGSPRPSPTTGRSPRSPADLGEPGVGRTLAARALDALGGVDILVNNSGGPPAHDGARRHRRAMAGAVRRHGDGPRRPHRRARARHARQALGAGDHGGVLGDRGAHPQPRPCRTRCAPRCSAGRRRWPPRSPPRGVTVNMVLPGRIATSRVAALDRASAERTRTQPGGGRAGRAGDDPGRALRHAGGVRRRCVVPGEPAGLLRHGDDDPGRRRGAAQRLRAGCCDIVDTARSVPGSRANREAVLEPSRRLRT